VTRGNAILRYDQIMMLLQRTDDVPVWIGTLPALSALTQGPSLAATVSLLCASVVETIQGQIMQTGMSPVLVPLPGNDPGKSDADQASRIWAAPNAATVVSPIPFLSQCKGLFRDLLEAKIDTNGHGFKKIRKVAGALSMIVEIDARHATCHDVQVALAWITPA
jgi:hypothetical protein